MVTLTADYGLLPPVRLRRIPKAVPLPDDMLLPIDLDHSVVALVGNQRVAVGKTDGRVLGGDEIWPDLPYGLAVRVQPPGLCIINQAAIALSLPPSDPA